MPMPMPRTTSGQKKSFAPTWPFSRPSITVNTKKRRNPKPASNRAETPRCMIFPMTGMLNAVRMLLGRRSRPVSIAVIPRMPWVKTGTRNMEA